MASCPLGHKCSDCLWLVHLRGQHPQSGQEVDQQQCAITWLPLLLIENARKQNETAAVLESFRNEMVRGNETLEGALLEAARGFPPDDYAPRLPKA